MQAYQKHPRTIRIKTKKTFSNADNISIKSTSPETGQVAADPTTGPSRGILALTLSQYPQPQRPAYSPSTAENATDDTPEKLDGDSAICIAGASHATPSKYGVLTL
ncbi:ribosome biogenesis protein Urb1 [Aspergillus luchuensis]|uniref:Ribosome biogenesis protein Urb1 n=1 Tax=Aspergillus kawachii TaxID=1069201 RepID=A0A146EYX3_ASPKA|nr:ribosome biogenesis protein Urb1 [Aspergillus luchuensis]